MISSREGRRKGKESFFTPRSDGVNVCVLRLEEVKMFETAPQCVTV